MMKILHTADWHLGAYVGPQCDDPMKRMENTIKCLDVLIDTSRVQKPDLTVICGDIFHQAKVWSDRGNIELRAAAHYIKKLAEVSPVAVLYGTPNHDNMEMFKNLELMCSDEGNGVWFFAEPKVCNILTNSGYIQVAGIPGLDKGFFRAKFPGLSAEEENKIFSQELSNIVTGLSAQLIPIHPAVLMAHHTVSVCDLDNGRNSIFLQNEVVLDVNALDGSEFDLVCLGHIHKSQRVDCRKPVFYSGSLDAFTFNDEGNEKGFLLHNESSLPAWINTPAREFLTCRWDIEGVKTFNDTGIKAFATEKVQNKVIRMIYSCDETTEKAFDKKKLECDLYAAGAYYVSEIRPEKIEVTVNQERMHEKMTVENCLHNFLVEKGKDPEEIEEIIAAATSIISSAQAISSGTTSGMFLPVEVEVHNYRSYSDEKFSFQDIFFAMVNGRNGSGKSSLFMDAITDCLYEETREGELTGWIRNGEKSGSITFTFKLGSETWRVTRTRMRSGKATLALSSLPVLGKGMAYNEDFPLNWEDHSCQKLVDTQQKIIDLLGMDCNTFQSCVLIMQDQYGKFMEARSEDRMNVLANLLGLSVYEDLEAETKDQLRDLNRSIKDMKTMISDLEEEVKQEESLTVELDNITYSTENNEFLLCGLRKTRDEFLGSLEASKRAKEELDAIEIEIGPKINQRKELGGKINDLKCRLQKAQEFLSQKDNIDISYTELKSAKEKLAKLDGSLQLLNSKKEQWTRLNKEFVDVLAERESLEKDLESTQNALKDYDKIAEDVKRLDEDEKLLAEIDEMAAKWKVLNTNLKEKRADITYTESLIAKCKQQKEILEKSNCIDFSNAKCNFLSYARESVEELQRLEVSILGLKKIEKELKNEMLFTGYSSEWHEGLKQRVKELQDKKLLLVSLESKKQALSIYTERLLSVGKKQQQIKDNLNLLHLEINKLADDGWDKAEAIKAKISDLQKFEEQWQQLPAAEQFVERTEKEIEELNGTCCRLEDEVGKAKAKVSDLNLLAEKYQDLQQQLEKTNLDIRNLESTINEQNQRIGILQEKLNIVLSKKEQWQKAQEEINSLAKKASVLEILGQAFGQDGIPHQIIRDIVPELEAAANEILSQMTGGRMRIEFRTERNLKSNKLKEIATLDIVIMSEKGELPYLSHSGGQRVRAALAVSFALAMVKASRVGLQLGMMFVDEPPFLDAEGAEAYCSALQFIHSKYPEMRIIAISHDENMKSVFPQQITIDVTDKGSKVIR